jgi:hypothetical protein
MADPNSTASEEEAAVRAYSSRPTSTSRHLDGRGGVQSVPEIQAAYSFGGK